MCVYLKPGKKRWWYSIYRGPGKPRLRGSTGKTDRAEAEAVEHVMRLAFAGKTSADRLHAMIDALSGQKHAGMPLAGVWGAYEGWAKSTGRTLADITWRQRRRACERFSEWAAESWPSAACAGEVDRACAAGFAAWLSLQGAAGKTRRNLIADLGTVWEGLRRVRDEVKENPWPLVLPADDGKRGLAFTREQEKAVIEAADRIGGGWGLACRIARFTGLRYGDVARVKWDAFDLTGGVVHLAPSKTARHGVCLAIPLCDELLAALRSEHAASGGAGLLFPTHAKTYPNPHKKGGPGAFAVVLAAAGVPGEYDFHSWRHTFRTRLAEAGVSDEIAKRLGGWTVDATALRYDHDGRIEELRDAVQRGSGAGLDKKRRGAPAAS